MQQYPDYECRKAASRQQPPAAQRLQTEGLFHTAEESTSLGGIAALKPWTTKTFAMGSLCRKKCSCAANRRAENCTFQPVKTRHLLRTNLRSVPARLLGYIMTSQASPPSTRKPIDVSPRKRQVADTGPVSRNDRLVHKHGCGPSQIHCSGSSTSDDALAAFALDPQAPRHY